MYIVNVFVYALCHLAIKKKLINNIKLINIQNVIKFMSNFIKNLKYAIGA